VNKSEARAVHLLVSWILNVRTAVTGGVPTAHTAMKYAEFLNLRATRQDGIPYVAGIDVGWPYKGEITLAAEVERLTTMVAGLQDELVAAERVRDKFQAALAKAGIETCTYCGHSYGGRATGEEIERHHAEPHPGDEVAAL
jgi:hypothetical protein